MSLNVKNTEDICQKAFFAFGFIIYGFGILIKMRSNVKITTRPHKGGIIDQDSPLSSIRYRLTVAISSIKVLCNRSLLRKETTTPVINRVRLKVDSPEVLCFVVSAVFKPASSFVLSASPGGSPWR